MIEAAPIPTISFVSPSGLVTIEWDKEMQIPVDLDEIAMSKVGLRNYSEHESFGLGKGQARQLFDKIKLIDALELRIAPSDGDQDED